MKTLLIGINSKYIHPSMGLYQLKANSITEVEIKEFTIKDDYKMILDYINESNFDLLGFSLYIWNIEIYEKIITNLNTDKPILLGGSEVSYNIEKLFIDKVTYIIKGEGENSFNELVSYLQKERNIETVSNLYYKEKGVIKYTFDKSPDLKYIKHDYEAINDLSHKIIYVEASRGCFFHCTYCMASLENNVRFFDIQQIKAELKFLLNKKVRIIKFLDRSFNVRKDIMMEIFNFIKDNDNYITTFQFEVVGDILSPEVITLLNSMRKNYIRLEIGIQSTNEKTLKAICRKQNFNKLSENIKLLRDNVVIHSDLIAGLPYEDYHSFINTFNLSFLTFSHELQLGFLKELKGTSISLYKDLYEYSFSNKPPYEVISNKYISKDELDEVRLCEEGLDKFYNKTKLYNCNSYLFIEQHINPFFFYHDLALYARKSKPLSKLQPYEIYQTFYEFTLQFSINKDYFFFILKRDYLTSFNLKPKIWWSNNIDRKEKRECFERIVFMNKNVTLDDLYKSSKIEKFQNEYYIVLYKTNKNILFSLTN